LKRELSMKFIATMTLGAALAAAATSSQAQAVLTGDTKLACEAVMCLSSSTRPHECEPSIRRYFSISYRYPSDTIRGRINFLKMCPASSSSPQMAALITAMGAGAGNCDAASLNVSLQSYSGSTGDGGGDYTTFISDQLPAYCAAYTQNAYTAGLTVRYVGTPTQGGYWVAAADWTAAQAAWLARIVPAPDPWTGGGPN
jgi:hypothetical protein